MILLLLFCPERISPSVVASLLRAIECCMKELLSVRHHKRLLNDPTI